MPQVIALCQCYNEAQFIEPAILNRLPHVDKIIITEGLLTPFGNMSMRSTDGTRKIIKRLSRQHDKICLLEPLSKEWLAQGNTREVREGINKNYMLLNSGIEHGDIIHVLDADEFYDAEGIDWIINQFKNDDNKRQCWPEEWQFAYSLKLAFKARHGSRFLRYVDGAHFGQTNHFFHGNFDLVKDKSFIVPREISGVCHLCWTKSPQLIREKVISFNRNSFTNWYNTVYLRWPSTNILHSQGFAEGQSEQLRTYCNHLPYELSNLSVDYFDEIKINWRKYLI